VDDLAVTASGAVLTDTRCPTVLVVDDEPDQLGLITTFLNREGCTVIAAISGEHVLSLPMDLPVDLIILDLLLPGVDGWQLAVELKKRMPGCPLVITSVLDVEDYPSADDLLPKPVTRAQVAALLSRHIPGRTCR
jgi:DNA-binding response OmpR family regulator